MPNESFGVSPGMTPPVFLVSLHQSLPPVFVRDTNTGARRCARRIYNESGLCELLFPPRLLFLLRRGPRQLIDSLGESISLNVGFT